MQKIHRNSTNKPRENLNKNNTYEIEFSNARGIVNCLDYHVYYYPCPVRPPCLGKTSLLKGWVQVEGGNGASATRLASSAAKEGSLNVVENVDNMSALRTQIGHSF